MRARSWLGASVTAATLLLAAGPAAAEGPPDAPEALADPTDAPSPEPAVALAYINAPRKPADRRDDNELNRRLTRGGMPLELVTRLAVVAYAARSCEGDACDRAFGMLPIAGPIATAATSPEDRPLALALAALEATSLTLTTLGVWDAWGDRHGRLRVGLRGPGLVVAGDF